MVFANGEGSVYLADMSGDGLSDLVRVRNGEVCYWPNLGYGRFGPKITMDGAPWFDSQDLFDERRIRLADLDGSGTADLVYLGPARSPLVQPSGTPGQAERPWPPPRRSMTHHGHRHRPARRGHHLPGVVVAAARR